MCGATRDVRFGPKADINDIHSITASARASSEGGNPAFRRLFPIIAISCSVKKDCAHSSVTVAQAYFSHSSSNNQFSPKKGMSPVILTIDRTAAYSDRQPHSCSMTSPHMATEPKAKGHP